ncbi:M15 family metallopeptidase [Spirobacillus cienkowskii]|uniref:M15 family metallopeptidase n=1 Tax=Spirobacillus cienkowskii TaxID=495820 RepID=UPI0030D4C68B
MFTQLEQSQIAINTNYPKPTFQQINLLKNYSNPIELKSNNRMQLEPVYFNLKLKGATNHMLTRHSVYLKLIEALEQLPQQFGFLVFDAFRSLKTQHALFDYIYQQQKALAPNLSHSELFEITKFFITYPTDNKVPPHNSGGAIDLTLTYNNTLLDMGTEFDEVSEVSHTIFFEQEYNEKFNINKNRWEKIKTNRRILFNIMKNAGFTNYSYEWWHYDLGDSMWAEIHNTNWQYPSMEGE